MFFGYIWILPAFHLSYISSVESVEIQFVSDFDEPLESHRFSPTDVFSVQHDYDLFLLNQEIDTPSDNLNHQDTHVCEKQGPDAFLIHATNLSHIFALPQFMTQHSCGGLKPTDTPSTDQPLFKLPVITPSIQFVLITQWQPSAITSSTSPW